MSALARQSIKDASLSATLRPISSATTLRVNETEIVNQHATGTCWIQAGLAFMSTVAKSKGYKIRFSSCYLHFFDKLHKSRCFIRAICSNLDDRTRWHWMQEPIGDGGTWPMFVHLVQSYGVIPCAAMRPNYQTKHTAQLNSRINQYLRSCVPELLSGDLTEADVMKNVECALRRAFTPPPTRCGLHKTKHDIDFDGTPQELRDIILTEWASAVLTHAPDRPTGRYHGPYFNDPDDFTQDRFDCVKSSMIRESAIAQLEAGYPVWFTADVRIDFSADSGIAKCGLHDVDALLSIGPRDVRDKAQRMQTWNTAPVHAMLLTGVLLDDKRQPRHWRVQNSWGKQDKDGDGFVTIDADWFDANVFSVAILERFVQGMRPSGELTPIEAWDVFSTVA